MNISELWKALLPLDGDPDHLAVIETDHLIQWTGIQLLALAHHLAALLNKKSSRDHPQQQQQVVGIYLENSATYIGAVLAAVFSGAAFLPLDPRWPEKKLLNTLENFRPKCIFYAEENSGVAGACGAPPPFNLNAAQTTLASISPELIASARQITTRKALEESIQTLNSTHSGTISSNIAYIMTTSGSTSSSFASPPATATSATTTAPSPLGVCGTALGIYKRIKWMADTYPFQKGDIVAFKTNPCFVDSIWEIFAPLLSGGTAIILAIPFSITVNPYSLLDVLLQHKVTHLNAVPSYWQHLVNASKTKNSEGEEKKKLTTLRQVVSSGEQLPWHLLHDLQERLLPTGCRILNLYGTTEVAADATVLDCSIFIEKQKMKKSCDVDLKIKNSAAAAAADSAMVPVGLPLDAGIIIVLAKLVEDGEENSKIELIKACPGAVGEVLIGGWGVAAGYYNHVFSSRNSSDGDVLLGDKFVYLEHAYAVKYCIGGSASTESEKRSEKNLFFRSGDIGSIDDQGRLCILGRKDLQVKINGVRVDLLEVEAVVKQHHAVRAVAVKMWPAGQEKQRTLGVYLELEDEFSSNDDGKFWDYLKEELINSLCGSILNSSSINFYFERMVKLPRSSGGKVDRSALQLPGDITILSVVPSHNSRVKRMKITSSQLSEIEVHRAFAAALGHHNFEPTSDLFSVLGGTSLIAASIAGMLGIEVEKVFQNPTVRSLSFSSSSLLPHREQQQRREQSLGNILAEDLVDVPELQIVWKVKMKDCVDARPLFYPFTQKQLNYNKSSEAAAAADDERAAAVVFGASHGGDVSCFDAATGAVVWSLNIPNEQPDPGMVVIDSFESEKKRTALAVALSRRKMPLLAVGLNSGSIKFLDATSTGEEIFDDTCINISGMRAAPAVDELKERKDLLWAAGHGKFLVAINNAAQVVATLPLPAAVSAGMLVKDSVVYIACLDGTLMAVEKRKEENDAPMMTATKLNILWRHSCKSPIFATPTVVKTTDSPSELVVVVVTASGEVVAVDAETGNELWHRVIDPVGYYIPAVYFENSNTILVGSHSGQLTWIGVADGSIKGSYRVESGGVTGMMVLPSNFCYGAEKSVVFYIVVSTADGQIRVFNSSSSKEESGEVTTVNVAGRFQLPAASFSGFSYGAIGENKVIYVGCRDDHLYCLGLPEI